ncbi:MULTISPECIES: TolC family protein [Niastella]|uniref:TolC family protein n=1 Tax=Niastella soli TaxID=2821487 RepID=A0ABS3YYD2_9BACT|nr:TolC family protein [Niastella soli]MBO9202839.1 TolC family protein [Niastella soli]
MDINNYIGCKCRLFVRVLLLTVLLFRATKGSAQAYNGNTFKLTLEEAVRFAKGQNKLVQAATIEESAAGEDLKDAYNAALPTITANGSYQRFSRLTLFTDGLSHSATGPRKPTPNGAALGVDALFNIYSGGKQRALQSEQQSRLHLARLNAKDQSGSIALQTAQQYLELVRLTDLQQLIADQLNRAQTRVNNINALYNNQKVTKSDVLRAEVVLSNVELSLQENENNLTITNQKLDDLLNIPDTVRISPVDSAGMAKPAISSLQSFIEAAGVTSYAIQKTTESIELQRARLKGIKSGNLPTISFYTAYGLNYPNYLFFPPVDQAYAIGFVGLKAQYSISSLYHNKRKVEAARLRIKEGEVQQQAVADNVRTEAHSLYIKYVEALTRIQVNERSVEQAQVNYKIVNTKYLNQLSLLTDLLDADNLYQESRFNLIRAQTNALSIYYNILYVSGNL